MAPAKPTILSLLAFLILLLPMANAGPFALPTDSKSLIQASTIIAPTPLIPIIPHPNGTHFRNKSRLDARKGHDKPKELTSAVLNDHYCFSKGDEYGVSRNDIMDAAYVFCNEDNPSKDPWNQFDFNDANGRDESRFEADGGAAIEVAATLIGSCRVASDEDVQVMNDFTCYDIAFGAWDRCYGNGGRGGAIDVGCVRYSVRTYRHKIFDLGIAEWDHTEEDNDIIEGVDF